MRLNLQRFSSEESGGTAIEYGLIAALIGAMLIASFQALGWGIYNKFEGLVAAVGSSGS